MSNPSFPDQLQELWRTRPMRLPRRGPLAGVAAGIAYRYAVDPVLIRVAFAVSTIFGGIGIILYLACWLLLPQAGDHDSAAESMVGHGHSSESGTKKVVLTVALLIAITTLGPVGVGLGGSGLISLALMLGGLWLMHQRRPVPPPPTAVADQGLGFAGPGLTPHPAGYPGMTYATGYGTGGYTAPGVYTTLPKTYEPTSSESSDATTEATEPAVSLSPEPPAWDPLGVAPFAWDLPEPTPVAPPTLPARPKSRLTSTVLGLAIIASAATWAVSAASGAEWLSAGRIGAVGLAVIGVGLVVGAFLRRGYGLLVVTGPLVGFVVLASLIGPVDWSGQHIGTREWRPANESELQPAYSGQLGDFTLDLRTVQLTEDQAVDITSGIGSFTVLVPPNMNVKNHCSIRVGDVSCLPDGLSGGAAGTTGPVLTLNMTGKVGDMKVQRG